MWETGKISRYSWEYRVSRQAACHPTFTSSQVYPLLHTLIGVVLPVSFMIGWNLKIVNIAKYHQYRIANAIFKMTFSHLNMTANERKRQEHSSALRRFQGVNAIITFSQLIGTIIIFFSPTYIQENSSAKLISNFQIMLKLVRMSNFQTTDNWVSSTKVLRPLCVLLWREERSRTFNSSLNLKMVNHGECIVN